MSGTPESLSGQIAESYNTPWTQAAVVVGGLAMKLTRIAEPIHQVFSWMILGRFSTTIDWPLSHSDRSLLIGFDCNHEEPMRNHAIHEAQFIVSVLLGPGCLVIQRFSSALFRCSFCPSLSLGRN